MENKYEEKIREIISQLEITDSDVNRGYYENIIIKSMSQLAREAEEIGYERRSKESENTINEISKTLEFTPPRKLYEVEEVEDLLEKQRELSNRSAKIISTLDYREGNILEIQGIKTKLKIQ